MRDYTEEDIQWFAERVKKRQRTIEDYEAYRQRVIEICGPPDTLENVMLMKELQKKIYEHIAAE